jgi:hypothetical protein
VLYSHLYNICHTLGWNCPTDYLIYLSVISSFAPLNTLRHQGRPLLFVVDFRITPSRARRTLWPTNRNNGEGKDTWEPAKNLEHAQDKVLEFYSKNPGAPRKLAANLYTSLPWQNPTQFTEANADVDP